MGIFYDFDKEDEADEEFEEWFIKNTRLEAQAKALGKACRASIVTEYEKVGLTEDDVKFPDIKVH